MASPATALPRRAVELDYCQAQGLQLKKDGPRWKCLCPLHQEKTPSFTITPEEKLFKCFGCGEGGSVIDLHSKLKGISIARRCGI